MRRGGRRHLGAGLHRQHGAHVHHLLQLLAQGSLQGQRLELTAGAGLVQGSVPERELQEVALKLGVLQQQLDLPRLNTSNASP